MMALPLSLPGSRGIWRGLAWKKNKDKNKNKKKKIQKNQFCSLDVQYPVQTCICICIIKHYQHTGLHALGSSISRVVLQTPGQ